MSVEHSVLKCKYCGGTIKVQGNITSLLMSFKNSKDGNDTCKKYGHAYIPPVLKKESEK